MPNYVYELRCGNDVIATGHLSSQRSLQVGEPIAIGGHTGIVRTIEPLLRDHELRLVVQLPSDKSTAA